MSPTTQVPLLTQGVARRFGTRWALRGISLRVEPGEVVGIMGHNGSGKSTLLRVVSTALRPSAGQGWVFGQHLVKDAVEVRRHIGFLAHAPGLYDDLTAHENLLFAARMLGVEEGRIPAAIERALGHDLRRVRAIVWKDLTTERRSKAGFNAVAFLGVLILLLFGFALGPDAEALRNAAAGALWLAILFAGVLAFNRS